MSERKYRLVTRSDFDGLVCAVLLKEMDMVDEITFVHPKDMQDGKIAITDRDITTNLPFVPGAYMVFDHHDSETIRNRRADKTNHVIDPKAPSAAREAVIRTHGVQRVVGRVRRGAAGEGRGGRARASGPFQSRGCGSLLLWPRCLQRKQLKQQHRRVQQQ